MSMVHRQDTYPFLAEMYGEEFWEFVPAETGRVNPLCFHEMTDEELDASSGYHAMVDNPRDISPMDVEQFAPIAAARRLWERGKFLYQLRLGTKVEAVWPHPCQDNEYHFFSGTINTLVEPAGPHTTRRPTVAVEFYPTRGKKRGPIVDVCIEDVRAPVHELTGHSVALGWAP